MLSAALLNQQGIVRNSNFDRGTLRFNLDQGISSKFRVGTRVNYSRSRSDQARVNDGYGSGGGPVTMMALRFVPTIPVRDSLGNFSGPLLPSQSMDNPLAIENLRKDQETRDYLLGNAFGEYDVLSGLAVRSSLAYTSNNYVNNRYISRLLNQSLNNGQANIDNRHTVSWLSENTATLQRKRGEHEVTLLGGFTVQQTDNSAASEQGIGFTSDELGFRRLNLATLVTASSSSSRERLLSGLGRLQYSYAGRYLLTTTLRTDGSSKFAANHKWATFPSAALAWRVSDEPLFRRRLPSIDELKLRASYGKTGVEAIDAYSSLAAWSIGTPYTIGNTPFQNGARLTRIPNPNLRWETTTQVDGGLDLALFGNRVSFTADAYNKVTSDLLYDKLVPYYTGYEDFTTNVGKIRNRGMELELDTRQAVRGFELRLGGNLSFNRNKVLYLGGDEEFFRDGVNGSLPTMRNSAIVRVGEPLGNYYGYVFDGIYQDAADVANSPGYAGAAPGREKLKDLNGDGKIDSNDKTILGNAQPKYILGQNGMILRGPVSLSYVLRAVQGFKVVNLNRQGMETPGASSNQLTSVLNYWSPTNHTNSMTGLGIGPYPDMTSRWIEDGLFVRLQNVTAAWTVPARFSSRVGLGDTRLYLSGQNLYTWTKYSWYDPEASSRGTSELQLGWDDSSYPGVRTFTLGWNVVF
jgi:TonB-linked SusC/RagA family outer membrane protein